MIFNFGVAKDAVKNGEKIIEKRTSAQAATIIHAIKKLQGISDHHFTMSHDLQPALPIGQISITECLIISYLIEKPHPHPVDIHSIKEAGYAIGLTQVDRLERSALLIPDCKYADWCVIDKANKKNISRQRVISQFWYFSKTGMVNWNPKIIAAHEVKHPLPNFIGVIQ